METFDVVNMGTTIMPDLSANPGHKVDEVKRPTDLDSGSLHLLADYSARSVGPQVSTVKQPQVAGQSMTTSTDIIVSSNINTRRIVPFHTVVWSRS